MNLLSFIRLISLGPCEGGGGGGLVVVGVGVLMVVVPNGSGELVGWGLWDMGALWWGDGGGEGLVVVVVVISGSLWWWEWRPSGGGNGLGIGVYGLFESKIALDPICESIQGNMLWGQNTAEGRNVC